MHSARRRLSWADCSSSRSVWTSTEPGARVVKDIVSLSCRARVMRTVPHYRARHRRAAIGRRDGSSLVRKAEAGLPAKSQPALPPSVERRVGLVPDCAQAARRAILGVYGHLDEPRHARHSRRSSSLRSSPPDGSAAAPARPRSRANRRPRKVTVAEVVARDITEWDEVTGRLEAVNIGRHPAARLRLHRRRAVRGGRDRPPRPGALPDRPAALPGAGRSALRRAVAGPRDGAAHRLRAASGPSGWPARTRCPPRSANAGPRRRRRRPPRWPRSRRRCVPPSSISSSPGSPRRSTAGLAGPSSPRATSSRADRARPRCSPRSCRSTRSTPRSTPTSRPSCATPTWPAPTAAPAAARPTCRCGWRSAASASSRMKGG